jgi:[ribosomal protein S5]-alanine N-acetyltransferase
LGAILNADDSVSAFALVTASRTIVFPKKSFVTSLFEHTDPLKVAIPTTLESERIVLRRYTLEDASALADAFNTNRARLQEEFPSRLRATSAIQDAEMFVWQLIQQWDVRIAFHFGVWEKSSKLYAGEISLTEIDWKIPKGNFSYFAVERFEGKGIISEAMMRMTALAFETLHMRKLQIRCSVDNLRSQRVAERCGFKIEGVLRNDFLKVDGHSLASLVYYGMTPSDYRAMKPPTVGTK